MALSTTGSTAVITRLHQAWNTHDLDSFEACLHPNYESIQPNHPERSFQGRAAARLSWAAVFNAVPDLQAELCHYAVTKNDVVWTEWRWCGIHTAGIPFEARGVMIFTIADDQILRAQVYTETIQTTGPDWEQVLTDILHNTLAQSL